MVIEGTNSSIGDLVPSFYYQLKNEQSGSLADLIAIQPATQPGVAFRTMIAETSSFDVGLAVVSERGLSAHQESDPVETIVGFTAILADGSELSETTTLGNKEAGQKALFPKELIADLPTDVRVAQLQVIASRPIYCSVLGVGTPPLFEDVQIGASPALPDVSTLFADDVESGAIHWSTEGSQGRGTWSIVPYGSHSPKNSWFVEGLASISDLRLTLKNPFLLPSDGFPIFLSFWHRYSFEVGFDGGVVEISVDGGQTWEDTAPRMAAHPYDRIIPIDFDNPLGEREAFAGRSIGDPDFIQTLIDLSDLAGQRILIRFRVGTDDGNFSGRSSPGWHLDNIEIQRGGEVTKRTLFEDNLEGGTSNWTTAGSQGETTWFLDVGTSTRSQPHSFWARSVGSLTDQLLTLVSPITIPANCTSAALTFWHRYMLATGFHGGVVEISEDGGQTWLDAGQWMVLNPYDGIIASAVNHPLAGREVFTTDDTDTCRRTIVDLTSFRGKSILFRFRMGTSNFGGRGWNVDDILVEAILP